MVSIASFVPMLFGVAKLSTRRWRWSVVVLAAVVASVLNQTLSAQTRNRTLETRSEGPQYRQLAPGVVTRIQAEIEEEETFSGPRPLVELTSQEESLKWDPNFLAPTETLLSMAKEVVYRRDVWALEFGFKPMRMITVPVRRANGVTQTQRVWYLMYYVKNTGQHLSPTPGADEQGNVLHKPERVNHAVRFFPNFVLQAHDVKQAYLDEVLPEAIAEIRRREDPNRTIYDSVSISSMAIPVSTEAEDHSVWGVATWVGVDPRSDFLSVYVQGLTNAYRWQEEAKPLRANEPLMAHREFAYKTLQLNFWRAGDAVDPAEDEIRFGVPTEQEIRRGKTTDDVLKAYGLKERVDYLWVYR